MSENYQIELDKTLQKIAESGQKPRLLLHCCCAPCTSYVLSYLKDYFDITLYFYNPNIYPQAEYDKRANELLRLVSLMGLDNYVVVEEYNSKDFYQVVKGYENCQEGGDRCKLCFELRLEPMAELAKEGGFDYFCTTLTISPHKNATLINAIGKKLQEKYNVKFLPSDFKKKDGYKKSIELSEKYSLYRQNYCGCEFSKQID